MSTPRSRLKRWALGLLAGLVVLVLVAAGVAVFTVQRSFPDYDGELALPGLSAEVTVYRDAHGIPQLYADTAEDLFTAQGYVHAQDRFWQMDFNRHTTAGRLAELFGPAQIETDAYLRTMGWRRVAEAEYDLLAEDTRSYLDAYAEGVNAYLADRDGAEVSLEYAVLGLTNGDYEIEEWSPIDSLAWLKAMAWDLRGNMEQEIDRAGLLAAGLTRDQVDELYPEYPEAEHAPIVTDGEVRDGAFTGADPDSDADSPAADAALPPADAIRAADTVAAVGEGLSGLPEMLGPASPELGSNSWVVSGEHTASGLPLLANDPHLGAAMPSVWHQMGLHCTTVGDACPFDVTGFGFAGLPGVVIGHNNTVAWGFTNLGPDVTDLYLEKVEGDSVIVDGEKVPMQTRRETIEVAGGENVEITVRSTGHGPLLSDAAAAADLRAFGEDAPVTSEGEPADQAQKAEYAVALSWTALKPGTTADAIFQMNRARGFEDFREAARSFEVPAQNLVYADVEGTIGYQAPGRIPVRGKGDGRWPAPGWDSDYDWEGYIPFEELPSVRDPESGYIVTANQAAIGSDYAHLLTTDWDYGYRAQRIDDLLAEAIAEGGATADDMSRIQFDSENSGARAVVPHLLDAEIEGSGDDGTVAEARRLLADWDFQQDVDSAAAAFYNATWRHLVPLTFDELGEDHPMDGGSRGFLVVADLLEDPDSPWWEGTEAGGRDEVLSLAMEQAAAELTERLGDDPAQWRWGDLHTLTAENQSFGTSGIAAVEWLFNRGPVEAAGGSSIVNASGWSLTDGYAVTSVPSMRMVVDLSDLDASRWVNLTGTSGHAFHDDYDDQMELWAAGETTPMRSTREAIEEDAEHELVLRPH
ncbi:penicillin amidase [Spinactinospora alkalitolerans]|uniref:Penicillin amidase n=1 Tax=Spinactinospora alkalitolerans TaxID=687207 RepID=A0A852U244_9ACTN|nr:penicillin acylase family protein [Spinactinospora alkalitolerans]NYE48050.1 penicillin amidase [Spinactinospora alkalitolerans]